MTTTNVGYWSELAEIHSRGDSYPVRQVIDGGSTLRSVERDLLGDPAGRRLFHAHCHIGLDTVSLARLGFTVTGADYSPAAVHHARRIAAEAGVQNCEFVVADSSEPAAAELAGAFDVYYASYGVLVWVPDTNVWFRAAATHGPRCSLSRRTTASGSPNARSRSPSCSTPVRRSPRRSRAAPRRPWCRSAGSPPRPVVGGWATTAPDRSPRRWATRCWQSSSAGRRTHTDGCTGYPG